MGCHFYCKVYEKNSQKAPWNYSASFAIKNLSISPLEKLSNPSFLWFLDLADVTMTPKTNCSQASRHQDIVKHPRGFPIKFQNMLVNLKISKRADREIARSII